MIKNCGNCVYSDVENEMCFSCDKFDNHVLTPADSAEQMKDEILSLIEKELNVGSRGYWCDECQGYAFECGCEIPVHIRMKTELINKIKGL